jgi:CDP-paratose 2-epimerase
MVTVLDNLSRPFVSRNLAWLQSLHGRGMRFIQADIRDAKAMHDAVVGHDVVYHLAGQVAVTTSVRDPRSDFEINTLGTINVLEAARLAAHPPIVVFSSTNKVYGGMEDVAIESEATCYRYRDFPAGLPETYPLDFHSPYGCSKGAADQYVRDYARIYGLKTIVFRQSCIYGPHQFGIEDQGWAAYFAIAAVTGCPITIYGDGKQVRDMLYIDDLILAYQRAVDHIDTIAGQVYNIGGGPGNSLSIWAEFAPMLAELVDFDVPVYYSPPRQGDQFVYISDIRKAARDFGWQPEVSVATGLRYLVNWVREHRELLKERNEPRVLQVGALQKDLVVEPQLG